jgi:hypothetical protein
MKKLQERLITAGGIAVLVAIICYQVAYATNESMKIINHVENVTIGSSGQYNISNSTAHINGSPGTRLNNVTISESPN